MADSIDIAQRQNERPGEAMLTYRKPEVRLQHTGFCHFCEEPVDSPKLFCNGECATQYDK